MSEQITRRCDMCNEPMKDDSVQYAVSRSDHLGHFDSLDACSAECLAAVAIGEAHERGERDAHVAVRLRSAGAPRKRWWQR